MAVWKQTRTDYIFQFNYCTIKSPGLLNSLENSLHFNSTIVRLKVLLPPRIWHPSVHFNSTIVRLKVVVGLTFIPSLSLFQFNYCTIKSCFYTMPHLLALHISIQLLYD